jgi:hypothetical protein
VTAEEAAGVRATVSDPDGVSVVLREERWGHIVAGHPELGPLEAQLLQAVAAPAHRRPGRSLGETWFYYELAPSSPSRWLKVVVRYKEREGWIVTAFLRRSMP